jgi:hypothetical protein
MNIDTIVVFALATAIIVLMVWIIVLELRIKRLLRGKNGASLEDTIVANQQRIHELDQARRSIVDEMNRLDARIKKKLHGVKAMRFNPFGGTGMGGNQSFAASFLDEDGNGIVLSSLYTRDKVSVFGKPVRNRTSEYELTEEEQEVLK